MSQSNVRLTAAGLAVSAVAIAVIALLLGAGLGAWATSASEPEVRVVTETDVVEVTPESCQAALNAADDVIDLSAQALDVTGKMVEATADDESARVVALLKKLTKLAPEVRAPAEKYDKKSATCRAVSP